MFGLGLMCIAMALFTSIDTSAKWLILSGLPIMQVVFVRYAGHFIASLVMFLPREGLSAFRAVHPGLQFLRALFLLASTAFNFAALKYLPITITTAIYFASPIVITILSVAFLGEKIRLKRALAILVGFVGVLIVVAPWGADFHPAMLLSLSALICASSYFVLTRRLAGVEANSTSQLWASGIATLALIPFGLPGWVWPATVTDWLVMLFIGIFAAVGHGLAVTAHRYAPASTLAPVTYVQAIYATASGLLVFGNLPGWGTALGTAIIIASGIYIWHRERALMLERRRVETAALTR
ncbi:DMT family transporter [Szabonella alba]|nr:DMT family transporter [Szabonella alba]